MATIGSIKVRIGADISSLEKSLKRAEFKLKRSGQRMAAIGDQLTSTLTLAFGAFSISAIKTAGDFESLEKGIESMMGSAELAKKEIALLRKEALKPGLNFKQALKGSVRLQAVKVDADTARRALAGFGNAIALVGGTGEQLDGVTLALSQIAAKGKISAEEINQLAERVPQIRQILKDAFGTADTEILQKRGIGFEEFISKVVTELERLPKAQGGIKNSLENLQLTFQETAAQIGKKLFPVCSRLAGATLKVVNAFTSLSPAMQDNVLKFGFLAAGVLALAACSSQDTPPPEDVNTEAGLPHKAPLIQRLLVESIKYFKGAAILPKRTGLPIAKPLQLRRSSCVQYNGPLAGIASIVASLSAETLGTVRMRASMPLISIPLAILCAS